MKIVCISDTHNSTFDAVPDGDILIHAGDATNFGNVYEIEQFSSWFASFPHKYKVFIAGNHDRLFETNPVYAQSLLDKSITYLQDSCLEIEGYMIYGSPWQPEFNDWAFNLPRGKDIAEKWAMIPENTNILITHGPPYQILDLIPRGEYTGCMDLLKRVMEIRPLLHVFGHIHHSYGTYEKYGIKFINSAICDESYLPINKPICVQLQLFGR